MIGHKFVQKVAKVAATVAVTGMAISVVSTFSWAATTLKNGDNVSGFIRTNSRSYSFKNESRRGSPLQTAIGEEYIFKAQQGDILQISIKVEDGSGLSPILVLTSTQTGKQVAYNDRNSSLRYQVVATGEYRLLVLGQNNSKGRYNLAISGISQPVSSQTPTQTSDQRRQFLQNEYGLRLLDSCPSQKNNLVVANFNEYGQKYSYCAYPNRALKAGEYIYDAASNELKLAGDIAQNPSNPTADRRKQVLQNEYGLRVLDNCPQQRSSLVVIAFNEYGQQYTYCAYPNRAVKAGEYTFDISNNELKPAGAQAAASDQRRQILQKDFGLTVLDNCPSSRNGLVVANFPGDSGQIYTYCANPTRLLPAGEYTYNSATENLEASKPQQPQQRCTVEIGGICIVK